MKHYSFFVLLLLFSSLKAEEIVTVSQPVTIEIAGTFFSKPIITHNNLLVIASHNKHVYFFDSKGNLKNKFKANSWFHATPAQLSDGRVALGSYDRKFYFFDADGNYLSHFKPRGFIFTNPVEFYGKIAFGMDFGRIGYYDLETEEISKTRVRRLVHGSPMVTSDSILVVGGNSKKVYFINKSKEVTHKLKTKGMIMHSKAAELKDGTLIIGSYDNHLYNFDKAGRVIWKFKTSGSIHSQPIQMTDENIVFGSMDGSVYIISSTGELVSRIETSEKVISSPSKLNDSVFMICSNNSHIYFIDSKGNVLGKYDTKYGKIFSSPIVFPDGTVFFATRKGKLFFLPAEFVEELSSSKL